MQIYKIENNKIIYETELSGPKQYGRREGRVGVR